MPSKEIKKLLRRIKDQGGIVELNNRGHFKITGPRGVVYIPSTPSDIRSIRNALCHIRRKAGIDLPRSMN